MAEVISEADQVDLPSVLIYSQPNAPNGTAPLQADQTLQLLTSMLSSGVLQFGPKFDTSSLPSAMPNGQVVTDQQAGSSSNAVPTPMQATTPLQDENEVPPGWSPTTAFSQRDDPY